MIPFVISFRSKSNDSLCENNREIFQNDILTEKEYGKSVVTETMVSIALCFITRAISMMLVNLQDVSIAEASHGRGTLSVELTRTGINCHYRLSILAIIP